MEEKEILEQTSETENTETQTVEENVEGIELTDTTESDNESATEKEEVKAFTQEEVNDIVAKRLARKEKEFQKELSKYKNVENVLNVGLGTKTIDEADTKLRNFYKEQGVELPEPAKPGLTDKELQILGEAEANEILDLGIDEATKEANRLASKGHEKWNAKERATFDKLVKTLNYEKQKKELKSIGASTEILDSKDFTDFASKFNSNASIKDVYNLYSKSNLKQEKNIEKIGSVKNNSNNEIKDFYTYEESLKFTRDDFNKNPKLFETIEKSMTKW